MKMLLFDVFTKKEDLTLVVISYEMNLASFINFI